MTDTDRNARPNGESGKDVLLLGATGGMGRRIASLWRVEAPQIPLRQGVRRREAIAELGPDARTVVVSLDDAASLQAAIRGAAVVINAIGPFSYDPETLLAACQEAGAHYVDLASEPEFLEKVASWSARQERAIAVCPGASTIPGFIELAAARLADLPGAAIDAVDVYLSMGSANRLTAGLLSSLTLQLGVPIRSADGELSYRRLRKRRLPELGKRSFGRYPSPFDASGITFGERTVAARFWVGLDRRWIVHALRALSYVRPRFGDDSWTRLCKGVRPLLAGVTSFGGLLGGLRIEGLSGDGDVIAAVNVAAKREGLNIPALPSVWAARALYASSARGKHALSSLISFDEAAESLRSHGFEVSQEPETE